MYLRPMGKRLLNGVRFCKCCGARILMQGYNIQNRLSHTMKSRQYCYDCAFWQDIIDYPPTNMEVLGDKCIRVGEVGDKKDKSVILGCRGKMRFFIRTDGTLLQSNDIWLIGTIPDRFKEALPPTLKEITKSAYKRLERNNLKCKARGCFDRYHCLRYNLELEKENGPFNAVPQTWKVGNEHCRSFINLSEVIS